MSHDNHMRDTSPSVFEMNQAALKARRYIPKHAVTLSDSMDHCCFSGCKPMDCPGRCCASMGWHKLACPHSAYQQLMDARAESYIAQGKAKHREEPRCSSCRERIGWYSENGSCGPNGCLNRMG